MPYKVEVNQDECIGCESCVGISDNFEMVDGKAKAKQSPVKELGTNQDAADACPVSCIKITKI